jgi:hypothetical protein
MKKYVLFNGVVMPIEDYNDMIADRGNHCLSNRLTNGDSSSWQQN